LFPQDAQVAVSFTPDLIMTSRSAQNSFYFLPGASVGVGFLGQSLNKNSEDCFTGIFFQGNVGQGFSEFNILDGSNRILFDEVLPVKFSSFSAYFQSSIFSASAFGGDETFDLIYGFGVLLVKNKVDITELSMQYPSSDIQLEIPETVNYTETDYLYNLKYRLFQFDIGLGYNKPLGIIDLSIRFGGRINFLNRQNETPAFGIGVGKFFTQIGVRIPILF
jgi:hypothetical protein